MAMDIRTLIIETDRQIPDSVCYWLNENGFQTERVSHIKYCRNKEAYAPHDLIIYMVGKQYSKIQPSCAVCSGES